MMPMAADGEEGFMLDQSSGSRGFCSSARNSLRGRRPRAVALEEHPERTPHLRLGDLDGGKSPVFHLLADGAARDDRDAVLDLYRALDGLDAIKLDGVTDVNALVAQRACR
jgi:hypothetical protein